MALTSGTGPDGGAPRVLLVAPPGPGEVHGALRGLGLRRGARQGRADAGPVPDRGGDERASRSWTRSAIAEVDPTDGVHLTAEGHATLGRAVAEAVRGLL